MGAALRHPHISEPQSSLGDDVHHDCPQAVDIESIKQCREDGWLPAWDISSGKGATLHPAVDDSALALLSNSTALADVLPISLRLGKLFAEWGLACECWFAEAAGRSPPSPGDASRGSLPGFTVVPAVPAASTRDPSTLGQERQLLSVLAARLKDLSAVAAKAQKAPGLNVSALRAAEAGVRSSTYKLDKHTKAAAYPEGERPDYSEITAVAPILHSLGASALAHLAVVAGSHCAKAEAKCRKESA